MLRPLGILALCAALAACDQPAAVEPVAPPAPRHFHSTTHSLNGDERITVADIPNAFGYFDRCVIYANDKTGASSMQCSFDGSMAAQ